MEIPENGKYLKDLPEREAQELLAAVQDFVKNKEWVGKMKRRKPGNLDLMFSEAHEKVFSETDCLSCAHCCKTTSPIVTARDVERLSKGLKIRPSDILEKYMNADGASWVMNSAPCPFLGPDNFCSVYDHRPSACREYPHTNRRRMIQIMDLTINNTFVCPAVARILKLIR